MGEIRDYEAITKPNLEEEPLRVAVSIDSSAEFTLSIAERARNDNNGFIRLPKQMMCGLLCRE